MMEKLTIENFLSIRSAEIEVRRINVLIGPQASGKSVIAKLLYFFKREVGEALQASMRKQQGKRELRIALIAKFETIFPRIYWHNQEFFILYSRDHLNVTLRNQKSSSGRFVLSVMLSDSLVSFQVNLKKRYKEVLENTESKTSKPIDLIDKYLIFKHLFHDSIKDSEYFCYFENQIFIPASRTFFAALQENIFSFLSNDIDIDCFLRGFGSIYESAKHITHGLQEKFEKHGPIPANPISEVNNIMESILGGGYLYENQQDWIVSTSGKINLTNASSGQQESLPMLLVLYVMPFSSDEVTGFFIEEPEAHLFPVSQKAFISLLALLSNTTPHQFFITTHSPYLLTALNNCILAHSTYEAADEAGKEKVLSLVPKNQHIAFEDVAAWTVTAKGTVESILDEELQLIGASLLDEVSQHFETVTNELLDIRYAEHTS